MKSCIHLYLRFNNNLNIKLLFVSPFSCWLNLRRLYLCFTVFFSRRRSGSLLLPVFTQQHYHQWYVFWRIERTFGALNEQKKRIYNKKDTVCCLFACLSIQYILHVRTDWSNSEKWVHNQMSEWNIVEFNSVQSEHILLKFTLAQSKRNGLNENVLACGNKNITNPSTHRSHAYKTDVESTLLQVFICSKELRTNPKTKYFFD